MDSVVCALKGRQVILYGFCVVPVHEDISFIIRGPRFLPPNLLQKKNQYNSFHGNNPKDPQKELYINPPGFHYKSPTSTPITLLGGKHSYDHTKLLCNW